MSVFDLSNVDQESGRADDLRKTNDTIERLAKRRKDTIRVEGILAQSKIAWKIEAYQQAILYRVVALSKG
jgi:hypothetical protein